MPSNKEHISASFRDRAGFIFTKDGELYRQVNASYEADYAKLMGSGLYQTLVGKKLLVPHEECSLDLAKTADATRILKPQPIPFIAYPYEWCFSQLKDAALLTLTIQRSALDHGMSLKDASAYNVQFHNGLPLFIDTLSFETYEEGQPWVAYRQFCQHFLAPLALMAFKDIRLGRLLQLDVDGVPLDLAASLLPKRSWLKIGLAMHLHLHSRAQKRYADDDTPATSTQRTLSRKALSNILQTLEDVIKSLTWKPNVTAWADYYQGDSYDLAGFEQKQALVGDYIRTTSPSMVWDLGANTGVYSQISASQNIQTVAWDIDPGAVELNYLKIKETKETSILPLVLDLTNPSPSIGWANRERDSFTQRKKADLVLALALIHHLAIGNNVPLLNVAEYFSGLAEWLVIEFVPKEDAKVKKLLMHRRDIFDDYTQDGFERAFSTYYTIEKSSSILNSTRRLYLMKRL